MLLGPSLAMMLVAGCGNDDSPSRAVVEVFGPVVGASGDRLAAALRDVSEGSAVELRYVGVTSYNEQLDDRLAQGDLPGVALLPQPGVVNDLIDRGIAQPLPSDVAASVTDEFPRQLVDLVARDGVPVAVPINVDVKGLVWYRPAEFAERGLTIPQTLDEVASLSERIRTSQAGRPAPWCVTLEDGAATGWVGTDWVEDYVLRRLGEPAYAQWVDGALPFDSPEIEGVLAELDELLRRPGAIAGGARAVLRTPWQDSASLLLGDNPSCLMVHQADFLRRSFPTGTTIGGADADVDFFVLPSVDGAGAPLIVGGMLALPLSTGQPVAEAMGLLSGTEFAERLLRDDDFLSPHLGVDRTLVDDPVSLRLIDLVDRSPSIDFDGSDLMPASLGTGSFWAGMRSFFAGEDLDAVITSIEAGVPATGAAG